RALERDRRPEDAGVAADGVGGPVVNTRAPERRWFRRAMPVTRDHVQVSLRLAPRVLWPAMAFATAFVVFARAAESTGRLPFAAVAVAAALAVAMDDEARATMAASPTSLLSRRLARSLLLVVLAALWWAALLWFTALRSPGSVMVKGRSLEATALAALALAVSAFAHRWSV